MAHHNHNYSHLGPPPRPSHTIVFGIAAIILAVILSAGVYAYFWLNQFSFDVVLQSPKVKQEVERYVGEDQADILRLVPQFLGFREPRTYLLLLLNNTEIRPAGGFIGSYSVIHTDKGDVDVLMFDGTENLDNTAPGGFCPDPPAPIREHLGVPCWYFRDSNWSPDFVASAQRGLEFYAAEQGRYSDQIDSVVAITPTVLEEVLRRTGPITIQGITFTADNVVETLNYEVEFAFVDRGIPVKERKQIIRPFMEEMLRRVRSQILPELSDYIGMFETLADERHILVYSRDENLQKEMDDRRWSGRVIDHDGDYLMWVDANLAALKTDHAISRKLTYEITRRDDGRYLATARMQYDHQGRFDWRTTRYRTYARIFVPQGAELVDTSGSMKTDRSSEPGQIDQGTELGKQWFGTFISIEPGQRGTLSFTYLLPENIGRQIDQGEYTLYAQKQAGIVNPSLTLRLDFGKTVRAADPAEAQEFWGDTRYTRVQDFREDQQFLVSF